MTCRKPISSSGRAFVDVHKGCGFESHMGYMNRDFVDIECLLGALESLRNALIVCIKC